MQRSAEIMLMSQSIAGFYHFQIPMIAFHSLTPHFLPDLYPSVASLTVTQAYMKLPCAEQCS